MVSPGTIFDRSTPSSRAGQRDEIAGRPANDDFSRLHVYSDNFTFDLSNNCSRTRGPHNIIAHLFG
jgi:hypothetical protein